MFTWSFNYLKFKLIRSVHKFVRVHVVLFYWYDNFGSLLLNTRKWKGGPRSSTQFKSRGSPWALIYKNSCIPYDICHYFLPVSKRLLASKKLWGTQRVWLHLFTVFLILYMIVSQNRLKLVIYPPSKSEFVEWMSL